MPEISGVRIRLCSPLYTMLCYRKFLDINIGDHLTNVKDKENRGYINNKKLNEKYVLKCFEKEQWLNVWHLLKLPDGLLKW